MPDVLYRFRSISRLLGESRELERRQIYLAPPEKLNDPMEGYKDVVWRGDPVLWENLLRHYVLSLLLASAQCLLSPPDEFKEPLLWAGKTEDDLPTDAFRAVYHDSCDDFFARIQAKQLYERLAGLQRPLHRDGLTLALSIVHGAAYAAVWATMKKHGLVPDNTSDPHVAAGGLTDVLDKVAGAPTGAVDLEVVGFAFNNVRRNVSLQALLQFERTMPSEAGRRRSHYLLFEFPDRYVQMIVEGLIHPQWRAACFTATCTNAANWASYGDQHKGVALMFRPRVEEGRPYLPLVGVIGSSSVRGQASHLRRGPIKGELREITYSRKPLEIDFFKSLGNLPRRKLERAWHISRAGEQSKAIAERLADDAGWRQAYWASFQSITTTKLEDWKHEEEYRIVVPDLLGFGEDSAVVEYEFSCLAGIVFGLRTPVADRLEVMRQVAAMCAREDRTDFEYKQMAYEPSMGRLVCV
jgi:hypothetical protein